MLLRVSHFTRYDYTRLTMGGEPTFVPLNPDGAEWQTAALGPTKRDYARRLARQLVQEVYPGAVVLETSGKLYPGEPLPRWALLIQHRANGQPLWRDITRLRGDTQAGQHTLREAERAMPCWPANSAPAWAASWPAMKPCSRKRPSATCCRSTTRMPGGKATTGAPRSKRIRPRFFPGNPCSACAGPSAIWAKPISAGRSPWKSGMAPSPFSSRRFRSKVTLN